MPMSLDPYRVEAVRAVEASATALRERSQTLEAQFQSLRRLTREHTLAAERTRALEADLRDIRAEVEREALAWRQQHPLREAASHILGEPEFLGANRAERERLLKEENALRDAGQSHDREARRLVEQEIGLWKALQQTKELESEAWQRVETLLRPALQAAARPPIQRSR